jgi:hypothetical protein
MVKVFYISTFFIRLLNCCAAYGLCSIVVFLFEFFIIFFNFCTFLFCTFKTGYIKCGLYNKKAVQHLSFLQFLKGQETWVLFAIYIAQGSIELKNNGA